MRLINDNSKFSWIYRVLFLSFLLGLLAACATNNDLELKYKKFTNVLQVGMDIKIAENEARKIFGYGLENGVLTRESISEYCRTEWRCTPHDLPQRLHYKKEGGLHYTKESVVRVWDESLFSIPYWVTIVYSDTGKIIGWINEGRQIKEN